MKYILLTALLVSGVAIASDSGRGQSQGATGYAIGFEEIKMACENPGRYHNQTAPTNIQISCREVQTKWLPDQQKSIAMTVGREITTSVQSDKYTVAAYTEARNGEAQALGCPRYKQVSESVETVRAVTCQDIVSYKGSGTDFCAETLDSLKYANQAVLNVTDTGRTVDFCGEAEQHKHRSFWPWN